MIQCSLDSNVGSQRTVSQILNEHGYGYLKQSKKEILSDRDKKIRRKFGRSIFGRMKFLS